MKDGSFISGGSTRNRWLCVIACECGEEIRYDPLNVTSLDCPECGESWCAIPPMRNGRGLEAKIVDIPKPIGTNP
jgi:hypothetical protein